MMKIAGGWRLWEISKGAWRNLSCRGKSERETNLRWTVGRRGSKIICFSVVVVTVGIVRRVINNSSIIIDQK